LFAGGLAATLVACGEDGRERPPAASGGRRVTYGRDPSQFADLRVPEGDSLGTVVLLHGGSWLAQYGVAELEPLADALTSAGCATWNLEYRRLGNGGGVPATLQDVAAGIDRLAGDDLPAGIADRVVVVGHSAGGHLAVWAASRNERTPGGRSQVRLRGAISLAGLLDLTSAAEGDTGDLEIATAVSDFVGGSPAQVPDSYDVADPARLAPATCPVWALRADSDPLVPARQSRTYVASAVAAGGRAEEVVVRGDHNSVARPDAPSFPTVRNVVAEALGAGPLGS
jgi:acetyl esterase/lipase